MSAGLQNVVPSPILFIAIPGNLDDWIVIAHVPKVLIFFQPFNDGLDGISVGHCIAHGKTFPSYTQCFFLVLFLRHRFRPPVSVVFVGFIPLTF